MATQNHFPHELRSPFRGEPCIVAKAGRDLQTCPGFIEPCTSWRRAFGRVGRRQNPGAKSNQDGRPVRSFQVRPGISFLIHLMEWDATPRSSKKKAVVCVRANFEDSQIKGATPWGQPIPKIPSVCTNGCVRAAQLGLEMLLKSSWTMPVSGRPVPDGSLKIRASHLPLRQICRLLQSL